MANIQLTTLLGTNSVASDRITINDNFSILKDNLNDVLSIVKTDINSIGDSNNRVSLFGSTIDILNNIQLGSTSRIKFGNNIELGVNNYDTFNTLYLENISGIEVPKLSDIDIEDFKTELENISNVADRPAVIVFDTDTNEFKGYNGTDFVVLG